MQSDDLPRRIRLMAEYGADPVWTDSGELDLDDLPISPRLRRRLREWAALYDTLPATKFRFQTPGGQRAFNEAGTRLARDLQAELGPDYQVEFLR